MVGRQMGTRSETFEETTGQGHPANPSGLFEEVAAGLETRWLAGEIQLSAAHFVEEARRSLNELELVRRRMSIAEFSAITVCLRAQVAQECRRLRLCLAVLTSFAQDDDLVRQLRGCLRLVAGAWRVRARFRSHGWPPAIAESARCQILWVTFQCLSHLAEHGAPSLQLEVVGGPTAVSVLIKAQGLRHNGADDDDVLGPMLSVLKQRMHTIGGSVGGESEDGCIMTRLDFVKPREGSA